MLAAISEFERQIISERTKLKQDQLKRDGVKMRRPIKVANDELKSKARDLITGDLSQRKLPKN